MFVKKVPNLSYIEKIRVVNQLQTQSSTTASNTNSTSILQPTTSTTIFTASNNNTSKQSSNKPTNMLLTRTYNNNTTNNYHYGRQHYMPHKTSTKSSNVQLMDHPNIPPYLLAMAKNSQVVQNEKESERANAFQKLKIQSPATTLQTKYSSSSLTSVAQSPISPSSMLDPNPMPNSKSDTKSVKRFIAHSQTHNLLQKNDLVFINIDEEMSILNMIDPLFHGKIGIIYEIREDDCVIEIVENNQKNNDDNMCFMNMTVNQPISHSFQPQSILSMELKQSRPSMRPLKRKIVVPIFCLCLEDGILKERLANNNGYQR